MVCLCLESGWKMALRFGDAAVQCMLRNSIFFIFFCILYKVSVVVLCQTYCVFPSSELLLL